MIHLQEEQSGRVSLILLHDAGFDIRQAPRAWWLLSTNKDPKKLAETTMPHRAAYLYSFLANTWFARNAALGTDDAGSAASARVAASGSAVRGN